MHALAGMAVLRRWTTWPLLPLLNLLVALCVLAYWLPKWYSYADQGISWYASDQLVPLYAVLVGALAVFTLTGRYAGTGLHWTVFSIHALVLLAAAVFFSLFRMDRLF